MPMRFLIETRQEHPLRNGAQLTLDPERSHYLCKVMRARIGDRVDCFDGAGTAFNAVLTTADNKRCELLIDHVATLVTRPVHAAHLGMSLLKGQSMDRALQQATELGAAGITLLDAARGNVRLNATRQDNKMNHWRKVISAACEQCGRLYVPKLYELVSVQQALSNATEPVIVLDQGGDPLPQSLPASARMILIGPEGGWDENERALFSSQSLPCYRLAATTLRAETVPAVALALLHHVQAQ